MRFTIGERLRMHLFGESHGMLVGVVVEGMPPGIKVDPAVIQKQLYRRKPGRKLTSPRKEEDQLIIASGIFKGHTTGAPVMMMIKNTDSRSGDYHPDMIRPGHADFTLKKKTKGYNDYRGGGTSSGRMTAGLVMAGSLARLLIPEVKIKATITQIQTARKNFSEVIERAKEEKDSVGGLITCVMENVPVGWGEPFFDAVESLLSHAMFSIPGVKGVSFGSGFDCVTMKGSEHNDQWQGEKTKTNNAGGILGGITNGMPVIMHVAVKPTSSIGRRQGKLQIKGRHDPCIAIRAVPVIENLSAFCLADMKVRA